MLNLSQKHKKRQHKSTKLTGVQEWKGFIKWGRMNETFAIWVGYKKETIISPFGSRLRSFIVISPLFSIILKLLLLLSTQHFFCVYIHYIYNHILYMNIYTYEEREKGSTMLSNNFQSFVAIRTASYRWEWERMEFCAAHPWIECLQVVSLTPQRYEVGEGVML